MQIHQTGRVPHRLPVFPDSRQLAPTRNDHKTGAGDTMNESVKQDNSQITSEIRALIDSDDEPGCKRGYDPALCRMRHTVAKLKESRGMRHEYEPCAYCPKFVVAKPSEETTTPAVPPPEPPKPAEQIQAKPQKQKPKEAETMKESFKCKCGKEISKRIAAGTGTCKKCRQKQYQAAYLEKKKQSQSAPKTGAKKSVCNETAQTVTQVQANVKSREFQEMPGVGEYIPEPAAATIHASCFSGMTVDKIVVPIDEFDVCRRAINQHGFLRQMAKAAEEFAEAAAAINRHMATEGSHEEIISELADVEVMCVQMRMIFGAASIDTARAEKVARLHGRLKS